MAPVEFYALAEQLLSSEKCPAGFRTVTSRAYYAAFLEAVEFLAKMGVPVERTAAGHKEVRHILTNSGDKDLADAGKILDDLRDHRNGADYRLHEAEYGREERATLRWRESGVIMVTLSACRSDQTRFEAAKSTIRGYASGILRLLRVGHLPCLPSSRPRVRRAG
jgi:hypothetical protein